MKFIIILLPIMGVACETCTRLKHQEHTNRYESGQRLERVDINTIREVSSAYQNAHGRVDMQENPFGYVNASKVGSNRFSSSVKNKLFSYFARLHAENDNSIREQKGRRTIRHQTAHGGSISNRMC
ncbi:unnamed protein product [Nippostrongylus brasiliensis]|uniref:Secreted protein n=1 Tax=Nippostrongylus brasiliensis TaxID=27835 RepID=A0A0N4YWF3_NIPBR|nr:unnamed protein product [Nippostrongylus brasiliensis]